MVCGLGALLPITRVPGDVPPQCRSRTCPDGFHDLRLSFWFSHTLNFRSLANAVGANVWAVSG
jgi:hypothetical protein